VRLARTTLLLIAALLAVPSLRAQPSPALQERLKRLQNKPPAAWTQADFEEFEDAMLATTREMLASGMTASEQKRFARMVVRPIDDDNGPPAWTDGTTVYVSKDALSQLIALGMYLGRDLYVLHHGELPIPQSLLLTPYRRRTVLPLLNSISELFLGRLPQQLIRCPQTVEKCAGPQAATVLLGTIGFVVAHEVGHVLAGHHAAKEHSVDEEVAADRTAWRLLLAVAPERPRGEDEDSLESRVRTGVVAAPFAVLRWLRDVAQRDADRDVVAERADQLRELAGDEYDGDPSSLVEPEIVSGQLRSVRVRWSEEPDALWLNGIRVAPREAAGASLRVMTPVRIFARHGERFAFVEMDRTGGDSSGAVTLEFMELAAGTPAPADLQALRHTRQWFRLFLSTATPLMRPRSPEVAPAFVDALERLGLGAAIDPSISRLARLWWSEAQPLGRWR